VLAVQDADPRRQSTTGARLEAYAAAAPLILPPSFILH
jgi:hypothetical protein